MFKNYLKIALRNLAKNKSHSLINIGGLTIGVLCAVVIFLVIQFEYSFNTHHENGDRIYRLVREETEFGSISHDTGVPYPLPEAMRSDFPEIEALTIVDANFATAVVSVEHEDGSVNRFREEDLAFVEQQYFDIFTYSWLMGDSKTALNRPNTAVISKSLARRLFGTANPVGRTVTVQTGYKYDLEVTGVIQDPPENSDMPFVLLASYASASRTGEKRGNDDWDSTSSTVQCYFRLADGISPESLNSRMDPFIEKYRNEEAAKRRDYFLQPLSELHFDTRFGNFRGKTVAHEMLLALGLIGLFLLITACINFVNLNTAIAVTRSKEVGVRKSLGGTKGQLLFYFLGETALVTLLALVAATGLSEVLVKFMEPLLGYSLEFSLFSNVPLLLFLASLFVMTTLAAGLYPAFYLAGFDPIEAIRNKISATYGKGLTLRRSLVILQFTISQVLIIGTIIISSQMNYFQSVDMGFDEEALVEVDIPVRDKSKLETFKNQLAGHSAIKSVAYSNTGTAHGNVWGGNYELQSDSTLIEGDAQIKFIDTGFLKTYGLELLAGSNLIESDTVKQYLVNEAFVRDAGFEDRYQDVIGRYVSMWGREAPIVGVVKDFNTNSLHTEIDPVLLASRDLYYLAGIKIDMSRSQDAIAAIEEAFKAAFPDYVFDYLFLDTRIENFYSEERQTASLMNIFTVIAILIGCLGLFGLVSYMAATRRKEVSVRKVLGATLQDILLLLSKEFFLLIGISFFVAAPLAWVLMSRWLEDFAYRIELGPGLFVMAFLATMLVAILTVGYKSLRTAALNPAENLKSE